MSLKICVLNVILLKSFPQFIPLETYINCKKCFKSLLGSAWQMANGKWQSKPERQAVADQQVYRRPLQNSWRHCSLSFTIPILFHLNHSHHIVLWFSLLTLFMTPSWHLWHHAALFVEQRTESRLREGEASEGVVQLQQECPVRVPSQASGHGLGPSPQGRIILTWSHIDKIFFHLLLLFK